jgi:DNA repair exonuclease SbcCD ATPase subunit
MATLVVLGGVLFSAPSLAQPVDPDAPGAGSETAATPLGVRQANVRRMLDEMEGRFIRISRALETAEPQHAARLVEALRFSKEARLAARIEQAREHLDRGEFDLARATQEQVMADLQRVLDILTDADPTEDLLEEMRQLESWRERVEELIEEEKQLRDQSAMAADRRAATSELDGRIAAVRRLIERQEQLKDETVEQRQRGIRGLDRLADAQGELRRETRALAEAAPPAEAGEAAAAAARVAQAALQQATERQQSAEDRLARGLGRAAEQAQDEALDELRQALKELQGQRDRIGRLPPEQQQEQAADEQDRTARRTGELGEQMAEARAEAQRNPSRTPADGLPPEPGSVEAARGAMEQASGKMRQGRPGGAAQDQQEAVDRLEQARRQIEQRLRQLREQLQEQMLAALETRFREMLSRQQAVSESTRTLDRGRADLEGRPAPLTRPQRLEAQSLSTEEADLADAAAEAMRIIEEDGTTVVFPQVVEQLRDDLVSAADLLADTQTGLYVQSLQAQIEQTLEELIGALEKAQQEGGGQGGQSGSQDQLPPLVPDSAELKLLKSAQLRVNRRTESLDAAAAAGEMGERLPAEARALADRQDQVRAMAEQMAQRAQQPAEQPQ